MLNKHSIKVILSFIGVILIGLLSLAVLDYFK